MKRYKKRKENKRKQCARHTEVPQHERLTRVEKLLCLDGPKAGRLLS